MIQNSFIYHDVNISEKSISYRNIKAKKIVFCEGFGIKKNPYFNYLPMVEVKGELITIHAPKLNVDFLIKAAVFVLPLGNNLYRVGATFNWKDKTSTPTEEGKEELISKLKSFITVPFKIVKHKAGIRPTIKDRRPIIGKHLKHSNMAVLNGLGTRGVIIAPTVAEQLYNHLEKDSELDREVSIERFH